MMRVNTNLCSSIVQLQCLKNTPTLVLCSLSAIIALVVGSTSSLSSHPDGKWGNYFYYFRKPPATFSDAEKTCNELGGNLASIHDGSVNYLLASNSSTVFDAKDFWIGLNTLMVAGQLTWTDTTFYDYANWQGAQPQGSSKICTSMTIKTGLWSASQCSDLKPYICEVSNESPSTHCPSGWIYLAEIQSCYGREPDFLHYNWTESESSCQSWGANLASFHSYEEFKLISDLSYFANSDLYIGLYSNDNEKTWQWSDGTPVDYLQWGKGYPKRNVSSCGVVQRDKGLTDMDCNSIRYFVCKKPALIV